LLAECSEGGIFAWPMSSRSANSECKNWLLQLNFAKWGDYSVILHSKSILTKPQGKRRHDAR
jgi:hypothetical protein